MKRRVRPAPEPAEGSLAPWVIRRPNVKRVCMCGADITDTLGPSGHQVQLCAECRALYVEAGCRSPLDLRRALEARRA